MRKATPIRTRYVAAAAGNKEPIKKLSAGLFLHAQLVLLVTQRNWVGPVIGRKQGAY